jgi:hypothetical protein
LNDLFEYGQEFMIGGNALGDGKPKDDPDKPREMTWQEKARAELHKDIDDLGKEDEEAEKSTDDEDPTLDDDHPDYKIDPVGEVVEETFDDDENYENFVAASFDQI